MSENRIIKLNANPEGFGQTTDDLDPDMFEQVPRAQHDHGFYADDSLGLYVGVWDTTDMVEKAGPYANDEFMFLIEGEAGIKNCRTEELEKVSAPDSFLIPRGYDCQWQQRGYLKKYYLMSENPSEPAPERPGLEGILVPGPNDPMQPLDNEGLFPMNGNAQRQRQHVSYQNHSGKFSCGSWQCSAFRSETGPMPCHLFACVQNGELTLTEESGERTVFSEGEVMFVPQDVVCNIEAGEETRLVFARVNR